MPQELINLGHPEDDPLGNEVTNNQWTQGRFEDWTLMPTFDQERAMDNGSPPEQIRDILRAELENYNPVGQYNMSNDKQNYHDLPNTQGPLPAATDCENLEDDRLLFFTSDNVKQMLQINSQMKNLYDYV